MNKWGLEIQHTELIKSFFTEMSNVKKAVIFGSRAKGEHRKYSDIDIALFGDFSQNDLGHIRNGLEELPLIYKFDAVVYDDIRNAGLKEHIDRVGIVIYENVE